MWGGRLAAESIRGCAGYRSSPLAHSSIAATQKQWNGTHSPPGKISGYQNLE